MELHNTEIPGGDKLIGKKYAAIHHLDVGLTDWLNIGLFEGVIFGRKDRFDFGYLNPIIFYRSIEQQNGSFDNSIVGVDAKANFAKKIQIYGQLSHRDSVANYTHYNQPLAHPLGANFREWIAIARYQPAPRWMLVGKIIQYQQGRDSSARSFGSNIFLPNISPFRIGDYGYSIGSGWKTNVFYTSLLISYEWKENLFLDLSAIYRKEETKTVPLRSSNTSVITFAIRWNMPRREIDF
jgi:hypothetical protein